MLARHAAVFEVVSFPQNSRIMENGKKNMTDIDRFMAKMFILLLASAALLRSLHSVHDIIAMDTRLITSEVNSKTGTRHLGNIALNSILDSILEADRCISFLHVLGERYAHWDAGDYYQEPHGNAGFPCI